MIHNTEAEHMSLLSEGRNTSDINLVMIIE